MATVLILAPDSDDRRRSSWDEADSPRPWTGELFETALVELVRTLDGPGMIDSVLVPWRPDTAALLAVATADIAPGFDPEGHADERRDRSRLIPYLEQERGWDEEADSFWRFSHMSLGSKAPKPLDQIAGEHRPTHVILLGKPSRPQLARAIIVKSKAQVLTFSSLADREWIVGALDLPFEHVVDLEGAFDASMDEAEMEDPDLELERRAEVELEPFVPFGLLLQQALDEMLFDDRERSE